MKKVCFLMIMLICSLSLVQANTRETVKLAKCVDGDTTHFIVDGATVKVRYLAINAPEYTKKKEPYGKEASKYVCEILTTAKTIELEYDDGSDKLDKYGRTLAWVYVDGQLLQQKLVEQGLAEVKYIYGDYAYTNELKKAEKVAKADKLNMWSDKESYDDDNTTVIVSVVGGLFFIFIGIFFTKGRANQARMIRKGFKQIKKSKRS